MSRFARRVIAQDYAFKLIMVIVVASGIVAGIAVAVSVFSPDQLQNAYDAYGRGDYATALRIYRALADRGEAAARINLGLMFDEGKGGPQDYTQAMSWFRKAADQGDAKAQSYLGIMYRFGQGVPQDYAEALKWYEKAANQGGAEEQFVWGEIIRDGRFTRKPQGSSCLFQEMTEQWERNPDGVWQMLVCESEQADHDKNFVEALEWFRRAAEQGHAKAQNYLGSYYYQKDRVLAHMWFNLAAAQGNQNAEWARDAIAKDMTPSQIIDAQKLAREWKPTRKQ